MTGVPTWRTLLRDVVWLLLPRPLTRLCKRLKYGPTPPWGDRPVAPAFAERLLAEGAIDASRLRHVDRPGIDMRQRMVDVLRRVMAAPAPGISVEAARFGLELTRPFLDKRVVELALAIPQELYVKNGRNRYVACTALKDVYPPEFQTRWRKNEDEIPDFQRMAKSIEPSLLADIARMEKSEKLSGYVNFAKIRHLLAARGPDDHNSGWELETQLALDGYMIARYIEWSRRDNC